MNGDKKVILHLTFDGILFDKVYPLFEEMEGYENRYLIGTLCKKEDRKDKVTPQYIKNAEKLVQFDNVKEWGEYVADPQVDIVYLHGLWYDYLKAIDFIRDNVVVMWWCYGMDIYENSLRWPPLLPIKIYKPKTHKLSLKYMLTNVHYLSYELSCSFPGVYKFLINSYNLLTGEKTGRTIKKMLSRIDYISTPLKTELIELKKRHSYIKAQPYELYKYIAKEPIQIHDKTGSILFEHSANLSNNHLDLISSIKKKGLDLNGREVYVPLSYGDNIVAACVQKEAHFKGAKMHFLMDTIPYNEYKEMLSGVSHAIYGMIRQSGLGNIYLCLKKGIKVFFFKDSILYKQFKSDGYYVYSIEEDLNDISIKEPLTPEQAKHNYEKYYSRFDVSKGNYQQQIDNYLKLIKK